MKPIKSKNRTYLVGAIEKTGKEDEGKGWRDYITPKLNARDVFVFDPLKLEGSKVNLSPDEFLDKLNGYKRSGHWECFMDSMNKIWRGEDLLTDDGKLVHIMGDRDYVFHSDFLTAHLDEDDNWGGTIYECGMARDAGIPIYLVTRVAKTNINSSLLWLILSSGGDIFRSWSEYLEFIESKYDLIDYSKIKIENNKEKNDV